MAFAAISRLALLALLVPVPAAAQTPAAPPRFAILDNSFLVEEAFNQERGVVQNIVVFRRSKDGFETGFTQEWPLITPRHQFSYEISGTILDGRGVFGDVGVNYRLQVTGEDGQPAFSPRLSVILPTSAERRALGARGVGWELNLPFSKRAGPVYFHWNVGASFERPAASSDVRRSPYGAGSIVIAVTPMFQLMLESVLASDAGVTERSRTVTVLPGFRTGWNLGKKQIVIGAGIPIVRGDRHDVGALGYFSYELPFTR